MTGQIFANTFKFVAGQTSPEDVLADGSYPASGAFIDVSRAERVHCVIHYGALADALTWTIQTTDGVSGTLANMSPSVAVVSTATDDDEFVSITIETAYIAQGDTHMTVTLSGVGTTNYADVVWYLEEQTLPVVQDIETVTEAVNAT